MLCWNKTCVTDALCKLQYHIGNQVLLMLRKLQHHNYYCEQGFTHWHYVSSSIILGTRLYWCYVTSSIIIIVNQALHTLRKLHHIVNQALLMLRNSSIIIIVNQALHTLRKLHHNVNQALLTLRKLQCHIVNQALLTLQHHIVNQALLTLRKLQHYYCEPGFTTMEYACTHVLPRK